MKVLIAAGGTGGHIYPGITIARTLQARNPEVDVLFIGNENGLEATLVPAAGFRFEAVAARYLQRRVSLAALRTGWTAVQAVGQSRRIIRRFRPDVALGTGGYVSGPVMLAALMARVPTVIQEQNAYPGLTSRLLGRFVRAIALGDEAAKSHFRKARRVELTGNPIRSEIVAKTRTEGVQAFNLRSDAQTLLVFGGSQGGASLNEAMFNALEGMLGVADLQIIWQTGTNGFEQIAAKLAAFPDARRQGERVRVRNVHVLPYIEDMAAAYAAADLVMCRAGAITLAELTARGLPAILVPYPYAAEDHQTANARTVERAGAAVIIADDQLDGAAIVEQIPSLLANRAKLARMAEASKRLGRPDAAERIAAIVEGSIRTTHLR